MLHHTFYILMAEHKENSSTGGILLFEIIAKYFASLILQWIIQLKTVTL